MGLCAVAIAWITLALTGYMIWLEPQTAAPRMLLGGIIVAGSAVAWMMRRTPLVRRRAVPFVVAFVVSLIAVTIVYWWVVAPQAADSATSVFIVIEMGTALLFPWGMLAQSVVCGAVLVGYGVLAWGNPGVFHPLAGGMLVATGPLVLLAAHLLEGYRSSLFERSWKQERFLALTQSLGAQLEPQQVAAAVLEAGVELLGAHAGSVMLRRPGSNVYRIEAVDGPNGAAWLGCEVPDDFGIAAQVAEHDVLALPEDDPVSPLLALLAQEGQVQALYAAVRDGGDVVGILSFTRGDMRPFHGEDRALGRALADHAGLAVRTARVITDLQEASRLKSEFVSTVSHEFRTPLNVILGYAEMGSDLAITETERHDCLARIAGASGELLDLIESTLEIGKLEAGRGEARVEPIVLTAFWRDLGAGCFRFPRRPGVVLDWQDDAPALAIQTDPHKLSIVVRNLVGNALKFTERGHVRAEVAIESTDLTIRITDTGIGIGPEDRETIFEMFRQVDGSDKRSYGGVGLGLYLVRRFVEQLGGTVSFESEMGRGTTFVVRLPHDVVPAQHAANAA